MAVITKTQLITNLDAVLSNNRSPSTRGGELNAFLKDFIDTIFQNNLIYQTTITSGSVVEIPASTHLLPFVTGIRTEDLSGNQIFIPNKIESGSNKVILYSDTNISYKLKIF